MFSYCSEGQLSFTRRCKSIEEQDGYSKSSGTDAFNKAGVADFSCMFRAYLEGLYLVSELIHESKTEQRKPLAQDAFLQVLPFDSFVNPQLYSVLCDAHCTTYHQYHDIADKLVYFNTDRRRPPVAGRYAESYVNPKTFYTVYKHVIQSINACEPLSVSWRFYFEYVCRYFNYMVKERVLEPSLCLNSDYKKLLHHIQIMQKAEKYTFGFVSTKDGEFDGGTIGHAMVIVAHKNKNQINLTCMDSFNSDSKYFKISAQRLKHMIKDPDFLKAAIVRYVCAIKSPSVAHTEIKALGLEDYPLYVNYYKKRGIASLLSVQKMSLLILLIISVYISQGIIY